MMNFTKQTITALIVTLLTGSGFYLGLHFPICGILMWVAPIPLLIYAVHEAKWQWVLGASFFSGVIGYFTVDLFIAYTIFFSVVMLTYYYAQRKITPYFSFLVFPFGVVAMELCISLFLPRHALVSWANTQNSNLFVMQLLSLFGPWGVTFFIALLSSLFVAFYHYRKQQKIKKWLVFVAAIFFLPAFFYNSVHYFLSGKNLTLRVGLMSVPKNKNTLAIINAYQKEIKSVAEKGVKWMILPGNSVIANTENYSLIRTLFAQTARQYHVTIVAGVKLSVPSETADVIWVWGPTGAVVGTYVPKEGGSMTVLTTGQGFAGLLLGGYLNKLQPALSYSDVGVGALWAPAIGQGASVGVMRRRAIEGGFTVVQIPQKGHFIVVNHQGKTVLIQKISKNTSSNTVVDIPIASGKTLYAKLGNGFAWVCCGLWLLILVGRELRV